MTDSLTSMFGVSSRNFITSCTILAVACLSWACFLESRSTWSLRRFQSPAFLLIVTMVIRRRDVVARSEAYKRVTVSTMSMREMRPGRTCRACFSSTSNLSTALWTSVCIEHQHKSHS